MRGVTFGLENVYIPPDIPDPPDPGPPKPWKPGDTDRFTNDITDGDLILDRLKNGVYQRAKSEASLPKNPIEPPSTKDLWSTGIDIVKGGGMPAKEFAKMILGGMADAAIASLVGKVANTQRIAYFYYAEGFAAALSYLDVTPSVDPFERKYFQLGWDAASSLNDVQRYQVQLALMHYYSRTPPSGWRFPHPLNSTFPADYARNWSPQLIALALYAELDHPDYTYR